MSILDDCNAATDLDKEEMKLTVQERRKEKLKEMSKASNLLGGKPIPRPGEFHKLSILTNKDNVKLRRKR